MGSRRPGLTCRCWFATAVAIILPASITLALWQALQIDERQAVMRTIGEVAREVQIEILAKLDEQNRTLGLMAHRWQVHSDMPAQVWEADADEHLVHFPGLDAIARVDSSCAVERLMTANGNEDHSSRWTNLIEQTAREAVDRDSHGPTIINTEGSKEHITSCAPIHLNGKFGGFVVGLVNTDRFFRLALNAQSIAQGYSLQIADDRQVLYRRVSSAVQFDQWAQPTAFQSHGANWKVQVRPNPATLTSMRSSLPSIVLGGGMFFAVLMGLTVYFVAASRRRSLALNEVHQDLSSERNQRTEAETAHRQSEQFLARLIDHSPAVIYAKNLDGRYLLVNHEFEKLLGVNSKHVNDLTDFDLFPEPIAQKFRRNDQTVLNTGQVLRAEEQVVKPDGSERVYLSVKFPLVNGSNQKYGTAGISTDITDQIEQQRYLELRTKVLQALADNLPLPQVLEVLVKAAEAKRPEMFGSVLLLDPKEGRLRHGSAPSLPDFYNQAVDGLAIGPNVGSCGSAAHAGQRFVVDDIQTHPAWEPFRELASRADLRACWSEPIISSDGKTLGTFAMYYRQTRTPKPDELRAVERLADLAALAIESRRRDELEQKVQYADMNMRVAREIQADLYPHVSPVVPGLDLAARCISAEEVGGDYFDYLTMPNDQLGVIVADVMGHGLGPALLMTQLRACLNTLAGDDGSPGSMLTRANEVLIDGMGDMRFISALLIAIDLQTRRLTYANAGHPSALVIDHHGRVRELDSTHIPLAIDSRSQYETSVSMQLYPGDLIFLMTDGVFELRNSAGNEYGEERVLEFAQAHRQLSATEIIDRLYKTLHEFGAGAPTTDDVTAMAIKVL